MRLKACDYFACESLNDLNGLSTENVMNLLSCFVFGEIAWEGRRDEQLEENENEAAWFVFEGIVSDIDESERKKSLANYWKSENEPPNCELISFQKRTEIAF